MEWARENGYELADRATYPPPPPTPTRPPIDPSPMHLCKTADRIVTDNAARRISVRRSRIHGRGVFARRDIPAGMRILEYRGQVITWRTAKARHAKTGADGHTYFFDRGDGTVIDGAHGGNSARYLNHSCEPNCEAVNHEGRIHIYTTEPVTAGSELVLDYQLRLERPTDLDTALYACACAAPTCRTTMLARH